jgi:4-amino-4-deoxy-L-arabinose transferase-like glycosyltransferase
MVVLLFLCTARVWHRRDFSTLSAVVLGVVAGIGVLISPTILVLFVGWIAATIKVFWNDRAKCLRMVAVSCLFLTVCVSPWIWRNWVTLGVPIWSRSNFWLEINVSNNDLAHSLSEENQPAMALMHPYNNSVQRAKYVAMGEIAYYREHENQAKAWLHGHPRRFLELTAARMFYFWFPRFASPLATLCSAVCTLTAFVGLGILFWQRILARWLFVILWCLYPMVYYLVQYIRDIHIRSPGR